MVGADADAGSWPGDSGGGGDGNKGRFFVSDVLKLLISHLQMVGLLRGLRIDWSDNVNVGRVMSFFDQTSTVTSWISLDCSLEEDLPVGGVRRSIKRTLVILMLPREWGPGGLGFNRVF